MLSGRLDRFTAPVAALRRELMHWFRYYSQLGDVVYTLEEDDRGLFTPEEGRLLHLLSRRLGRLRDDAQLLREYCLQVRELFQDRGGDPAEPNHEGPSPWSPPCASPCPWWPAGTG